MNATLALLDSYFRSRRDFQRLRGSRLKAYQDQRARAVVAHAVARAPFYAQHYRQADLADWRTLPSVDKQLMMANFAAFNTHGIGLSEAMEVALSAERCRDFRPTVRGLTVGLSSGTSGHRSLFLADRNEQARWVGVVLARLLPPFRLRGYTVTLFSQSGSNLYEDLRGRWIRFCHHDLATAIDAAVHCLNAEQPDLLCGPPSYLEMLAIRQTAGELRISPRKIVSVAEVLEPQVARALAESFGCPVFQIYQCTEGLIGISCPHGQLHLQEDIMASQFEPLGTTADAPATPVITDLWHRTLPIIRYRLNDVVTLSSEDCTCGSAFQVIENVGGRCDDVCEFLDANGSLKPIFPATLRRLILLADEAISDYEALQQHPSQLHVRVTVADGADPARLAESVENILMAGLREQGVVAPTIEVETGIIGPVEGKRRRIRKVGSTDARSSEIHDAATA